MSDDEQTANSSENRTRGAPQLDPYKFKPGESGNPSGRPKKKPITEMYERILSRPENIEALELAVNKALSRGQMAMVLQLREMTDRIEGKVTQPIQADITVNLSDAIAQARKRAGK